MWHHENLKMLKGNHRNIKRPSMMSKLLKMFSDIIRTRRFNYIKKRYVAA